MDDILFDTWNRQKKRLHSVKLSPIFYPKEREVWMCHWGKNIGFEENGSIHSFSRPALVVKKINSHMYIVLPLTLRQKKYDFYCNFTAPDGSLVSAMLAQIKMISVKRFKRKMYMIPECLFSDIKSKLLIMLS